MKRKPTAHPALALAVVAAFGVIAAGLVVAHDVRNRSEGERVSAMSKERTSARTTPGTIYADRNKDGIVTRREADVSQPLARSFNRYDLNDDGALDRAEFARLEADSTGQRDGMRPATAANGAGDLRPREEYAPD